MGGERHIPLPLLDEEEVARLLRSPPPSTPPAAPPPAVAAATAPEDLDADLATFEAWRNTQQEWGECYSDMSVFSVPDLSCSSSVSDAQIAAPTPRAVVSPVEQSPPPSPSAYLIEPNQGREGAGPAPACASRPPSPAPVGPIDLHRELDFTRCFAVLEVEPDRNVDAASSVSSDPSFL